MLRTSESETEILLGNKQLLSIFFAVALLLGLAFYGGYAVGKGVAAKKTQAAANTPAEETSAPAPSGAAAAATGSAAGGPAATGGETHSVPADSGISSPPSDTTAANTDSQSTEPPLGSPKRKNVETQASTSAADSFTPRAGQSFLQVTAVSRDEAFAIADVLQKKGFHAHAVPKPGGGKLYRVLVGPIHDAADLSSTRDSLRRTGFREVIVQRY